MNEAEVQYPDGPFPEIVAEVLEAVSRRSWEQLDAVAEMTFCVEEGKLVRVIAEVVRVSFGAALLRDPDQDPRRYFEGFLGADGRPDPP